MPTPDGRRRHRGGAVDRRRRAHAAHAAAPAGLLELEELLADAPRHRVGVQMGAKRGRVTIDFADLEDLERIYHRMAP